jgi:integrase
MAHYRTTGQWKHLDEAERRLAHLSAHFAGSRVPTITREAMRSYADKRLAQQTPQGHPVAAATVNRELAMLRRMLRLGSEDGKVAKVPSFRKVMLQEAPARSGFVDEGQYRSLLHHLRPDLRAVVTIAYTYGWRVRSEVLTLERRHVDLKSGTLRLDPGSTKNRDGRVVYMEPAEKAIVADQLARVDALQRKLAKARGLDGMMIQYLFPHLGGPHAGEQIAEFRKAWRKAVRAAGLPGLLVHDLRRSAVRNMERAGVPRSVAMKMTGHKTESVYRRYAIVSDADLRDASRRLGTLLGTQAGVVGNPVG